MRLYLPYLLAGLIVPLATFSIVRDFHSIWLAIVVVAAIGGASTLVRMVPKGTPISSAKIWIAAVAFAAGVLISEAGLFTHYYVTFGYRDQKINAAIQIAQLEFTTIAVMGSTAIAVCLLIRRWISRRKGQPDRQVSR